MQSLIYWFFPSIGSPSSSKLYRGLEIVFPFVLLTIVLGVHTQLGQEMDEYELVILWTTLPALLFLTRFWATLRLYFLTVLVLTLFSIFLYQVDGQGSIQAAESRFFLKYILSSPVAVLWFCSLIYAATISYFVAWGFPKIKVPIQKAARQIVWTANILAGVALMNRWYESYLVGSGFGHIPISNLYEVFILFGLLTCLFFLYFESRFTISSLGGLLLAIVALSNTFLLWYAVSRKAAAILPLVPALQSWWMKIHVPANFVGYGMFSLAAMLGVAYLITPKISLSLRQRLTLPDLNLLETLMYKTISVGFAFFTIATILGALWAAEAWGGYWSWDPKEVWALIVWLNYAAWLHLRLTKGIKGQLMAWWAIGGLLVTSFAFLGVNMFLSGLHSYGSL